MKRISEPVVRDGTMVFPDGFKCPMCGYRIGEPHQFVTFNGGALFSNDKYSIMDKRLEGFLDMHFHGAHDCGAGYPSGKCRKRDIKKRGLEATVRLADKSKYGQFEFYFCSTKCLRLFFNACVDRLETKLERGVKKARKRKTK